jgi:hypothetical protein
VRRSADEDPAEIAAALRANYEAQRDAMVAGDADAPVLIARTPTEATIWGSHGTWPLQLRINFILVGGSWLASDTVASTWS